MIRTERVHQGLAGHVLDSDGNKIGEVAQVYLDDESGQPEWVTVNTGPFGTSESFVPLVAASVDGENVRIPFSKEQVEGAPRVDDGDHLDAEQERELYRYYGLGYDSGQRAGDDDAPGNTGQPGDRAGEVRELARKAIGDYGPLLDRLAQ